MDEAGRGQARPKRRGGSKSIPSAADVAARAREKILNAKRRGDETLVLDYMRSLESVPSEILLLDSVRSVAIFDSSVQDISILSEMDWLQSIKVSKSKVREVPKTIGSMPNLVSLDLSRNDISAVRDIDSGAPLTTLNLHGNPIVDISGVAAFGDLRSLFLGDTKVVDIRPVAGLKNLSGLYLHGAPVSDISYIASLKSLSTLTLGRECHDISVLSKLKKLRRVVIESTKIADLSALGGLHYLDNLTIGGGAYRDISPLSSMTQMRRLDIRHAAISDLSPIAGMAGLNYLRIANTDVSDLSPLANLMALMDAASDTDGDINGIEIQDINLNDSVLEEIFAMDNPERTVLGINYIRGKAGLSFYWPANYIGSKEVPTFSNALISDASSDSADRDLLAQRPAPYRFVRSGGKLQAEAQRGEPFDSQVAEDVLELLREKATGVLNSLVGNCADTRVQASVERFLSCIDVPVDEIREGVLLMRFRSLEGDATTYRNPLSEADRTVRSLLDDLVRSGEDFLSLFPRLHAMEASRQALRFSANSNELDAFRGYAAELLVVADRSPVVGETVKEALAEGSKELDALSEVIATSPDEHVRAAAIEKRASIAGLQALDLRNFASASISWFSDEIGPVFGDSWKEVKASIPRGVGKGIEGAVSASVKVGVAALMAQIAGPVLGLGVLIGSFLPLGKRAEEVRDAIEN